MLRWLAVLAVVLNVIYFAVNYSASDSAAKKPAVKDSSESAAALQLLSELQVDAAVDEQKNKTNQAESLVASVSSPEVAVQSNLPSEQQIDNPAVITEVAAIQIEESAKTAVQIESLSTCWEVGKFADELGAMQMQQRLKAIGHTLQIQKRSVLGEPDYWVFLGPYRNRREALSTHRDLQTRKIDSFLINEGELENAVSLGLFSLEAGAKKMQQQRKKQGLDAQLRAVPRLRNEWWGVMQIAEAQLSDVVREKILMNEAESPVEIRSLACESIANTEKLD